MRKKYEDKIQAFKEIISFNKLEHSQYDTSELIEGEITFINGWRLEFMEFQSSRKHKYRFHLMNEENELVTRWDTAPHHPELENSPFHKHTENTVEPTKEHEGHNLLEKACNKTLKHL